MRQAFAFDEAPFELYHFPTEECVHSERIKVNGPASYEAFKHTLRMQLPGVPVMWAYPLPPPASGSVATSPPQGPVPAGAAATAAASTSAVAAAAATAATAAVITAGASATAGSTPSGRRALRFQQPDPDFGEDGDAADGDAATRMLPASARCSGVADNASVTTKGSRTSTSQQDLRLRLRKRHGAWQCAACAKTESGGHTIQAAHIIPQSSKSE